MIVILRKPALSGSVSHFPGNKVTQCRYNILSCQLSMRAETEQDAHVLFLHPWYTAQEYAWNPKTAYHGQWYCDGIIQRHVGLMTLRGGA